MRLLRPRLPRGIGELAWLVALIPVAFAGLIFLWATAGENCEGQGCHNPAGLEFLVWIAGIVAALLSLVVSAQRMCLAFATLALLVPAIHMVVVVASG